MKHRVAIGADGYKIGGGIHVVGFRKCGKRFQMVNVNVLASDFAVRFLEIEATDHARRAFLRDACCTGFSVAFGTAHVTFRHLAFAEGLRLFVWLSRNDTNKRFEARGHACAMRRAGTQFASLREERRVDIRSVGVLPHEFIACDVAWAGLLRGLWVGDCAILGCGRGQCGGRWQLIEPQ